MYEWIWEARPSNTKNANAIKPSEIVLLDKSKPLIKVQGTELYTANLSECTCMDFVMTRGGLHACKHMIRLAMELGIVNQNGNTPEQQDAADEREYRERLSMAYGRFHLFHEPVMSDEEYDALKAQYEKRFGKP